MDQGPQRKARYPGSDKEKTGNRLELIGTWKNFLNRLLIAQALNKSINKRDCMKLKLFCIAKDTIQAKQQLVNEKMSLTIVHPIKS